MAETANLGLKRLVEGQISAEVSVNESWNLLDALGYFVGITQQSAPPGSPADGDWYLVANSGATGAWSGQENRIAGYYGGWIFISPRKGMQFYRQTQSSVLTYNGTAWA